MNIDQLSVNTLRFLSVEAIQKAKSGHPGLPMGAAPAAYALWAKNMRMTEIDLYFPQAMARLFYIHCFIYSDIILR